MASDMADLLVQSLAPLPEDCAWSFGEPEADGARPVLLAQGKNLWRMAPGGGAERRTMDTSHFAVLSGFCQLSSSLSHDAEGVCVRRYRLEVALPGGTRETIEFTGRDAGTGEADHGESLARRLISAVRA